MDRRSVNGPISPRPIYDKVRRNTGLSAEAAPDYQLVACRIGIFCVNLQSSSAALSKDSSVYISISLRNGTAHRSSGLKALWLTCRALTRILCPIRTKQVLRDHCHKWRRFKIFHWVLCFKCTSWHRGIIWRHL